MRIEDFKKVKIEAMKARDKDAVDALNAVINKLMLDRRRRNAHFAKDRERTYRGTRRLYKGGQGGNGRES